MVLARFVLLAAFLLAASSVSAAEIIDLGPSDYRRWGSGTYHHHTNGLNAKFGQTVRMPPMNTSLTVTRNPVIPYGSIANGAKNFVRINPASAAASAAITALFLGLDWVFDQELDSWMKRTEDELNDPEFGAFYADTSQGNFSAPTPEALCSAIVPLYQNSTYTRYTYNQSQNIGYCYGRPNGTEPEQFLVIFQRRFDCPEGYTWNGQGTACVKPGELIELSDADFQQLAGFLPSANPDQVGEAAADIQRKIGAPLPGYTDMQMEGPSSTTGPETTTTTTTETGDNIVTTTTTTTNYNYGDTTITTTNTTTSTTYTNGNHTSTETTTETPGELPVTDSGGAPPAGEWPGFCDWATVVCDFIEWFQEPFDAPEVEWPLIEDQDYEEEFDFTLAASCPEPYTIELALFPPVQFNWQPFCDLATFIRPLVLASAAIFAAFISLGIARART